MKKIIFAFSLLCCLSTAAFSQNLKISLTGANFSYKSDGVDNYQVTFKVASGKIDAGTKAEFAIVQNNQITGYAIISDAGATLKAGETTKYGAQMSVISKTPPKAGTMLVSFDLAPTNLPANRTFSFKTGQAFLGNQDNEFSASIENLNGALKVGDALEYVNYKGERGKAKIKELQVGGATPPILIPDLPPDARPSVVVVSETKADFTNATVASLGGLPAATASASEAKPAKAASKDKIKKIPVNVALENGDVKITIHNLIKYNPDSTNNQYDMFKVDYSLDYYIVDCTFENKSDRPIDAGEYMLRLNFYDKNGKSADEFLRLFKAGGSRDAVKKDAEKVDANILGGTSKLAMVQVIVKYQQNIPNYETAHRAAADAIVKTVQPRQKVRSEMATIMGVPPTYKIEGIGTWAGTFFNRNNLLFAPIALQ